MRKKRASTVISVILLGLIAVAFLFPFAWMVATSLKPTNEVFTSGISPVGSEVAWDNYPSALRSIPFGRVVLNSFIVSLSGAALVVIVSILSPTPLRGCVLGGATTSSCCSWARWSCRRRSW